MKEPLFSDQKWISELANGNPLALRLLFDHYYPVLVKALLRYSTDEKQINIWIQDIYTRIWLSRANLKDGFVQDFRAYLIVAARNCAAGMGTQKPLAHTTGLITDNVTFLEFELLQKYYREMQKSTVPQTERYVWNRELTAIQARFAHFIGRLTNFGESVTSKVVSSLRQEFIVFFR